MEHKTKNSLSDLKVHYHKYDRDYTNSGYLDEYYSESVVLRGERNFEKIHQFLMVLEVNISMIGEILRIEEVTTHQQKVI